jgi:threonine dehydratase
MESVLAPSIEEIREASRRIAGVAVRTPLIPLNVAGTAAEIHLKLENLQPVGCFKIRGAANALIDADPTRLEQGVYTASAGNMAQGLAWVAREMGVPCRVIVPDHTPRAKLDAIARLGANTIRVPFDDWWRVIVEHSHPGVEGLFVHPVSNRSVIAGNGTIGIEIVEDLPNVDAILVPYGGGGLSSGIAAAARVLSPDAKVYACEVASAAPLEASLRAGSPQTVAYTPSFVDGIGGKSVLEEMWPMVRELLHGSIVVSLDEFSSALRVLVERNRVIAEGAGAASVAAALTGRAEGAKVACVVSGGNIDIHKVVEILSANR